MSDDIGEKQKEEDHAQNRGPVDANDLEAQATVMNISYRVGLNDEEECSDGGVGASNTANEATMDSNVPQSVRKWLEAQQQREDNGTTGAPESKIVQSARSGGATTAAERPQAARR